MSQRPGSDTASTYSANSLGRAPSTSSYSRPPPPASSYAPKPPPAASASYEPPPPAYAGGLASSVSGSGKRAPPPPPAAKPRPPPPPATRAVIYVTALYDYAATAEGDLTFATGDRIELVKKTDSSEDWWTGRINGVEGVFPGNYVQLQ